jgi:glyoxylase-like metal-dependent hydrolase (beta-lactamase superfamily II)
MNSDPLICTLPSGIFATNTYVLGCPDTKKAIIIDPAQGSTPSVLNYLKNHQLVAEKILLTHSHWDHIADIDTLRSSYGNLPIYVHPADAGNLQKPGSDGIPFRIKITPCQPEKLLTENEEIDVGNMRLKVIHTPGHSPGAVCFYEEKHKLLFSGDTLFHGSIGNLSLPTGQPDLMWDSLNKLTKLPLDTKVFPGHGPSTTLREENWLPNAKEIFGAS